MGGRAKMRARQRTANRKTSAALRSQLETVQADPRFQAVAEAAMDDEVRLAIDLAAVGQIARLRQAGYRLNMPGDDGLGMWDHPRGERIVHSVSREADGEIWAHTSLSYRARTMPGWYELRDVQWLLYPERTALVIIAPQDEHYSVSEVAHAWTCLSRDDVVPDFRKMGTI